MREAVFDGGSLGMRPGVDQRDQVVRHIQSSSSSIP